MGLLSGLWLTWPVISWTVLNGFDTASRGFPGASCACLKMSQTFNRAIIQIDLRDFDGWIVHAFHIHSKSVIL